MDACATDVERSERAGSFESLLQIVDLTTLDADFFTDLIDDSCDILPIGNCRRILRNKVKEAKQKEAASRLPPHLFYHARDERSSTGFVLSRLEGLRNATDVTFEVPNRFDHAVVVVEDDVFVVGDFTASNEVSVINCLDGRVSSAPTMAGRRTLDSACGSLDGRWILVFGGWNGRGELDSSCESFEVSTRRWTPLPPMLTRRTFTSAIHVSVMGFLVIGGTNDRGASAFRLVEVLSEEALLWRRLSPMLEARMCPGVAVFRGRLVVAGGGRSKTSVECVSLDSVGLRQWTRLAGFEGNRRSIEHSWHSLVPLGEKLIMSDENGLLLEFSAESSTSHESQIENFSWKDLFRIENFDQFRLLAIRRRE